MSIVELLWIVSLDVFVGRVNPIEAIDNLTDTLYPTSSAKLGIINVKRISLVLSLTQSRRLSRTGHE